MPTTDQIRAWWAKAPDANVALVLGRGAFAVDLDGGIAAAQLLAEKDVYLSDDAPRSKTGGGGYHVFFRSFSPIPDRVGLLTTDGHKPQVDIRGVGIVVVPPSIHPSGAPYEWDVPLTAGLPTAPLALTDLIHAAAGLKPHDAEPHAQQPHGDSWVRDALLGVGEGQRDHACTRLAGFFLGRKIDPELVTTLLTQSFARNCQPPFAAVDVRKCVQSIARRERVTADDETQVSRPEHISEVLARLDEQRRAGPAPAVHSPYPVINKMLSGGYAPGELIFVGAYPGVGKTALALESVRYAGKRGDASLVISREMKNIALGRRMVSQESRVASTAIKTSSMTLHQEGLYREALHRLSDLPIWMTDQAVSLAAITAAIEQTPRQIKLLVVDYLQLVRAPRHITDRRLQVEEVSKSLKTIAIDYDIPVICISSLSRPPKTAGAETKPKLSDLRESGELEFDADVVLLLHRTFGSMDALCIVAKNREGSTGECKLRFTPECVSFAEAEAAEPDMLP